MNREILFRGKRTDNEEWIQGGYGVIPHPPVCFKEDLKSVDPDKHCIVCENSNTFADWGMPRQMCLVDVHQETIGQYTGKKDKCGKPVFSGDVLKLFDKDIGVVEWCNHDQCYVVFKGNPENNLHLDDFGNYGLPEYYEVIGNRHDNPELLSCDHKGGAE